MVRNRLVVVLLVVLSAACGEGSGPLEPLEPADGDGDGIADAVELALLRQYRPYWNFDVDETLFPMGIEEWARAGGRVVGASLARPVEYDDLESLLAAVRAAPSGTMQPSGGPLRGELPCPPGGGCPEGAPVYGEVTPLVDVADRVWIQYWLFYGYDEKRLGGRTNPSHRGDWEHVCVLASSVALGDTVTPIEMHFHHHLTTVRVSEIEWVACLPGAPECVGARHPNVYVDRGGHGSYPASGTSFFGPHRGGLMGNGGLLETPLVPIRPHSRNLSRLDDDVLRAFQGVWGHDDETTTGPGPSGPLVFTDPCDHDFLVEPTLADWRAACPVLETRAPAR